jgi:hypothetical protein
MIKPESVIMYRCPLSGNLFHSLEEAERSQKELSLLKERDEVRLNATSYSHAIDLLCKKAQEIFGLTVNVTMSAKPPILSDGTYSRPRPGSKYLWKKDVRISVRGDERKEWKSSSIPEILFCSFEGFRVEGIQTRGSLNQDPFVGNLGLNLEFFPLIEKRVEELREHLAKVEGWKNKAGLVRRAAIRVATNEPVYKQMSELIKYYERCQSLVREGLQEHMEYYESSLHDRFCSSYPCPVIPKDLSEDFNWEG